MTNLKLPTYSSKEEFYKEIDYVLSEIPAEEVFLAHFKTPEFVIEEDKHKVINRYSIRTTEKNLERYQITTPAELSYKIATCFFSENSKTLGLKKHFHLPKTDLPTITIGKKIYSGKDEVQFKFYRKNGPPDFILESDFVVRFDSCRTPHSIDVNDGDQSIWLFIVYEHCGDVDLEIIKRHFNCNKIYDYYEKAV
jgi:hypothetical protein